MVKMAQACCLSCGLKELGVGSQLVNYAKLTFISVSEIIAMKHFYIKSLLYHLDEDKKNAVMQLCESLIQVHGREYAPLFHAGYFYNSNYMLSAKTNGSKVIYGQVGSGEVLEIMNDSHSVTTTEDIISGMKMCCVKIAESNKITKKLAEFVLNKGIRISLKDQRMEVMHGAEITEIIQLYRCNGSFEAMFHELFYYLEKIESVSLLIVDYAKGSPMVNEWLKFFASIYGGLSLHTCVFIISLDEFGATGSTSVEEIKKYVNFDLDLDSELSWLDLTSVHPNPSIVEKVDPFLLQHGEED